MAVDQSDQTSQKYHWSLHYSGDYFKLFSFLLVIQKKTRYGLGSTTIFARLRSRKNKQVFCFVFSFFSDHLTARLCSSGDLILIYFSSQGLGQPGEQVFRYIPKCAKRKTPEQKWWYPNLICWTPRNLEGDIFCQIWDQITCYYTTGRPTI